MNENFKNTFQIKERDTVIPCMLVLVELLVFVMGGCFQRDTQGAIIEINKRIAQDLGDWILSFTTITVAIFVLCYSVLDAKRLGVSNRTIIRYFLGNKTLPLGIILILVKAPILKIFQSLNWNEILIIEGAWTMVEELTIILFIIISSSMAFHIYIIRYQEAWQYRKGRNLKLIQSYTYWKLSHVKIIMESDSIFGDKANAIYQILDIPLKEYMRQRKAAKEDTYQFYKIISLREKQYIYNFYYEKTTELFEAVSEMNETQKLYEIYYEYIYNIIKRIEKDSNSIEGRCCIEELIIAAIMNAILMSEISAREEFCRYILVNLLDSVHKQVRRKLCAYYIFSLEFLYRQNKNVPSKYIVEISSFLSKQQWSRLKAVCLEYWHIIIDQTTVDRRRYMKYFYDAICTLEGKNQNSALMLYLGVCGGKE